MAMNILGEQVNPDDSPLGVLPLDHSTTVAKRDWRPRRIAIQHGLIVIALALFGCALAEPALCENIWGGEGKPWPGAVCLLVGVWWYPSNGWLLLSPIIAACCSSAKSRAFQMIVLILSACSVGVVLVVPLYSHDRDIFLGCYLWVAAHCIMLLAYLVPVWRDYGTPRRAKPLPKRGTWPPEPKHRRSPSSMGF